MSFDLAALDRRLDRDNVAALILSSPAFKAFKAVVPRKAYRQRQGTRFVNAYRGVPIEIHDDWAWGWKVRPTQSATPDAQPTTSTEQRDAA